ncbi:MAG: hypothetical protein ABI175_23815, partial [Polyangiales bacterium]
RLRAAGLTEGALLAWAGTRRIPALGWRLPGLVAREPVPAAAALSLFVAGAVLDVEQLGRLPLDALIEADLLERRGDRVRAPIAVLPLEASLVVCDRHDRPDFEDLVHWPDDSSYHLASALGPGRRPRWLDLACGSAFAPLYRPELGTEIRGYDLNARAVRYARLGAVLSGCRQVTVEEAEIGTTHAPAALVTCNAPIPGDSDAAIWRRADDAFFTRLWPAARACTAPDGEVVVHSVVSGIPAELAGEVVIVVYTPPGERGFAITWWAPDRPARRVVAYRALTQARPHLDARDRDDALAGHLTPLDE